MSDAYSPAIEYLAQLLPSRLAVRDQWKRDAPDLVSAHEFAFSALVSMIQRNAARKVDNVDKDSEGQICLIAQFVLGIETCETAIAEGLYSQAAALLKQELETIAAIEEYRIGRRKEGDTPKIRNNGPTLGCGPAYGKFNEISHVSRHDIARRIVTGRAGDLTGASLLPQYSQELAFFLYGQHVSYITTVVRQADQLFQRLYGDGITKEEVNLVGTAIHILLATKVIDAAPDAPEAEADYMRAVREKGLPTRSEQP